MKIAITFLLLGLVGSASSILSPHLPVTNAVSLANLAARVLASCDRAWKPCTCDKSNDQICKELPQLLNSVRALVAGVVQELGGTLDELLGKLNLDNEQKGLIRKGFENLDNEQKGLIRKGFETGDWTGFITKYGHSAQTVLSCLVQAVLNLVVK
ncbi:uncharacterized protein O3C94_001787 [Discoglossus pictus]